MAMSVPHSAPRNTCDPMDRFSRLPLGIKLELAFVLLAAVAGFFGFFLSAICHFDSTMTSGVNVTSEMQIDWKSFWVSCMCVRYAWLLRQAGGH